MSQHRWDRDGERCLKCGDKDWLADSVCRGSDSRPCTCHPDDSPPVPCQKRYALTECRLYAAQARVAELEAENAALRAERDGYSARLDAAIKLIADILSALPPNAIKAPDGTIYEFDPPPEYAMQMLRAFKAGIDAAIREGR